MKALEVTPVRLNKAAAPVLRRKCACGQHTIAGGQCEACGKQGLTVGESNDQFERDAESAAARVTGLATGAGAGSDSHPAPSVSQETEGRIRGMAGQGDRLPVTARNFFEPRFGHDFSRVRVHANDAAAALSSKLDADAFTFGQDIFFNKGRYNPAQPGGRHLLAHELAHVVQQNSGAIARSQLRRAKIPYRALTWADFKGAVPAGTPWSAETASGFTDRPGFTPKRDIADTGKRCTTPEGRETTEFKATISTPANVVDGLASVMNQDESWVLARYKNPAAYCKGPAVKSCEADIDTQTQQSNSTCDVHKAPCEEFFKKQEGKYSITLHGQDIVATKTEECATLVSKCKTESAKDLKDAEYSTAVTKKDCSGKPFEAACLKQETSTSKTLLQHEQGHFDITKAIAAKALPDVKTKIPALTVTETGCGKVAANDAAVAKYTALDAGGVLDKRIAEWSDLNDKAQKDYDNETVHGTKSQEQSDWETKIAAGLTAYTLTPPAAATGPTGVTAPAATGPTTPGPATPPAQPAPAPGTAHPGQLQRKCACGESAAGGECDECRKKRETVLQRHSTGVQDRAIPPVVDAALRSNGRPLEPDTRLFMESRFRYNFSNVRIHADSPSATAVNALAYTVGNDIAFAPRRYAPGRAEGNRLIAHELAHVIQQSRGISGTGVDPDPSLERGAEQAAHAVVGGGPVSVFGAGPVRMARQGNETALLPALSPSDLLKFLLDQRGFGSSPPGPAPIDPKGVGAPMGKGYETYAAIQIVTKDGAQVRVGVGAYLGGGQEHGEAQAVAALRAGLPKGVDVTGGKMMVAVEKLPCPGCAGSIEQMARELGLSEYTVYLPDRASMTNPAQSVTAKQAARTVFQGGRPPTLPKAVTNEKLPPKPGGSGPSGGGSTSKSTVPDAPQARPATPAAKAMGSAAGALTEEARAAARSAAASVASDFKILRAARVVTTISHVIQFISALQMLQEMIEMTNNALANKGFILTKEIAQSKDLADQAGSLEKEYAPFSESIGNSGPNLFKATADAQSAGRSASAISEIQTQLGDFDRELTGRIDTIDAAEREAAAKQRAAERILEDPQASAAIATATFGTAELAKLFAASQDLQQISGNLRTASRSLKSVKSAIAGDAQFLDAWFQTLFAKCEAGGICSHKDIQIPLVGTSHVKILPGSD